LTVIIRSSLLQKETKNSSENELRFLSLCGTR